MVFYWGKTECLWSLRSLDTSWTKWPKSWPSRSEFLEFSTQPNLTAWVRWLKGPFINSPWSKSSCTGWNKQPKFWPSRQEVWEFFSLQNPHTFGKKKFVKFCVFWPTLKLDLSNFEDFEKKFWSIVANCVKISNLFSRVRLDDAELTFIVWRENYTWISALRSFGARTKAFRCKFN